MRLFFEKTSGASDFVSNYCGGKGKALKLNSKVGGKTVDDAGFAVLPF